MPQGTISRMNLARGFGFLRTPEGAELFFHRTNVAEIPFTQLQVGDRVTYELQYTDRGPRAGNVRLHVPSAQLQVNLAVRDLDRAVDFYVNALGFKKKPVNPAFVLLLRDELVLGLKADDLLWHPAIQDAATVEKTVKGLGVELVLEVSDIQYFYNQIQQAGITVQEPLTERPWDAKDFRILDPEGYYWRITSPRRVTVREKDEG